MKSKLAVFSLGLITLLSAASSFAAGVQTYSGVPTSIQNGWGAEGYYFYLTGTNNGCTDSAGYMINATRADYSIMIASIKTAHSTGRSVNIVTDGTCPNYGQARANVISVVEP